MKVCICTMPIRPYPTNFPPFGSMAIIQSLREIGCEVQFYNIDYYRYPEAQIREYFRQGDFDMVGISAVVSTAYAFAKKLSGIVREVSPRTTIVVGGNLAASAEILLRKTRADFCVVGDGEYIIQNLARALEQSPGKPHNFDLYRDVKGIAFIDEHGQFEFTGYGPKPSAEDVSWPDFTILEADKSVDYFIADATDDRFRTTNAAAYPYPKHTIVITTKGCVARCTFCHRWEKGYRAKPATSVVDHVRHLRDHYRVGFLEVGDENFGSDKKAANELAERFHELGLKWRCAGVRTRTVTKEALEHWKANGCVAVVYGIESGSPTMLEVMEKNTTVEQNVRALKWTAEAGLHTVVQLVLGMPGETDKTIGETIDFLKTVSEFLDWGTREPSVQVSLNYAQALPGTPLYEWAREKGFIGTSIEDEEKYLLRISDTDAYSEDHFINYTGLPLLKVLCWRPQILAELDAHYFAFKGVKPMSLRQVVGYYYGLASERLRRGGGAAIPAAKGKVGYNYLADSGYFNVKSGANFAPLLMNPVTRPFFYPLLCLAVAVWRGGSAKRAVGLVAEHLWWSATHWVRQNVERPEKSLRKVAEITQLRDLATIADKTTPLRQGR